MNYNLYLSSNDKISGTNNNATFQVNWSDFLDLKYDKYTVNFTLQTDEAYYVDGSSNNFNLASVILNTNSRTYSYSTTTKNQSNIIGYLTRGTNGYTVLFNLPSFNLPQIYQRPTSNNITISFINLHSNSLVVSTDINGNTQTDMSNWNAILSLTPVIEDKV